MSLTLRGKESELDLHNSADVRVDVNARVLEDAFVVFFLFGVKGEKCIFVDGGDGILVSFIFVLCYTAK